MAKQHFLTMKLSEVERAPGSFLKKRILSQFMRNYQHNTGNKKNIMAVLSMPYSLIQIKHKAWHGGSVKVLLLLRKKVMGSVPSWVSAFLCGVFHVHLGFLWVLWFPPPSVNHVGLSPVSTIDRGTGWQSGVVPWAPHCGYPLLLRDGWGAVMSNFPVHCINDQ